MVYDSYIEAWYVGISTESFESEQVNWQYVAQAPTSERAAVADMARVLVAVGEVVGGIDRATLTLPKAAELKADPEIVAALMTMVTALSASGSILSRS